MPPILFPPKVHSSCILSGSCKYSGCCYFVQITCWAWIQGNCNHNQWERQCTQYCTVWFPLRLIAYKILRRKWCVLVILLILERWTESCLPHCLLYRDWWYSDFFQFFPHEFINFVRALWEPCVGWILWGENTKISLQYADQWTQDRVRNLVWPGICNIPMTISSVSLVKGKWKEGKEWKTSQHQCCTRRASWIILLALNNINYSAILSMSIQM